MNRLYHFIKEWKLPTAMFLGAMGYFILESFSLEREKNEMIYHTISQSIEPVLIFIMLFLSFLKVRPKEIGFRLWQGKIMLLQCIFFLFFAFLSTYFEGEVKILMEGIMLCFICPSATASPVIVEKLGGDVAGNVTYLICINLLVSLLSPLVFPCVVPHEGTSFFISLCTIMKKVFPLLICPLLLAWGINRFFPSLHRFLEHYSNLSFNIWMGALSLAILSTFRSIFMSDVSLECLIYLAIISLVCCIFQFGMGRYIGKKYGERATVASCQSLGQKNTIFMIWLGITFLDPVTAVSGGFYCLWHNSLNAIQLHRKESSHSS